MCYNTLTHSYETINHQREVTILHSTQYAKQTLCSFCTIVYPIFSLYLSVGKTLYSLTEHLSVFVSLSTNSYGNLAPNLVLICIDDSTPYSIPLSIPHPICSWMQMPHYIPQISTKRYQKLLQPTSFANPSPLPPGPSPV